MENDDSTAIRPPWTASQIQAFLPERGTFTFPAPYNTEGIRLTNATDCGGRDCVVPIASSDGRNINNHRGRDTVLVFLGLRDVGPTLFGFSKATGKVRNLGPLFDSSSPYASASGEGWYFSGNQPSKLYITGPLSAQLQRYDVFTKSFETVFDASTQFGADTYVWQAQSSDDDSVHSATLRDSSSHTKLGCLAYREDARQYLYYPATEDYSECQIDKSGRWLVIKEELDGVPGRDNLIVDLETRIEKVLPRSQGAGGRSANGYGYMVAADEGGGVPGTVRVWDLDKSPLQGSVVYTTSSGVGGLGHIAHSNAKPGVPLSQQYACAAKATTTAVPRANEVVCFRLDGSRDALVVTQSMTNLAARGARDRHLKLPTGGLDVTGGYFIWVSSMGGGRADAFMVKVPAQLLIHPDDAARKEPIAGAAPGSSPADTPPSSDKLIAPAALAADPVQLPVATTAQVPLTAAYNARNVPSLPAGGSYLDPTTNVKIYKITSGTFPGSSSWGHDYAEGGDEVSLPYNGNTRAVLVYANGASHWLIDFTPGVGVSNPRPLTGSLAPAADLSFAFSNNPATPYYAYVSNGSSIVRFDIRTMTAVPGNGWPQAESNAIWLQQSENDGMFVWMRGATGSTMVAFEPATNTKKAYTDGGMNEPRIDRGGRYVGLGMNSPLNALRVWDWNTNSVIWSTSGDPGIPFAHGANLKRRWLVSDWNMGFPKEFAMFTSDVPNSGVHIGGPSVADDLHGNGNWIQNPADLNDQWALFANYGSLRPSGNGWLSPGGMVLITPNGQRRLLGHHYNTTSNYTLATFAKFSPDGKYVLFTSDMDGSARSDLFLAELPQSGSSDTTPPTVSITAPAGGAIVSGTAVAVSANASDNVGVAGVQFKLDGNNLGAEDTTAPYSVSWNTTLSSNGSHSLTALARDAAGNSTVSGAVSVTVNNVDSVPPVISSVSASGISSLDASILWTTNEPADSQVEYGPTTSYGSSTTLNASFVLSHSQPLTSLAAGTLYHYRVKSRDAAGNLTVSGDFTFTTLQRDAGLIAYWMLNEGTGTTTADSSGSGNTGTLMNGAAWTAGTSGTGVALDGVNDYVRIPHAAMLNAFPLSAAVWFKTSTATGVVGLVNKYVASSDNGYQIFFNNGDLCAWYIQDAANYVYAGGGCTMQTAGYNDGLWHQAVLVVDAAGGRLYVDGAQKATQAWTGVAGAPSTTQEVHLGHYPGAAGGAEYLPGTIDEVRLYNRALATPEVLQLYTDSLPGSDTTPPLLSGVGVTSIGATSATIVWTTDEPANSRVNYGLTSSYGTSTPLDSSLVLSHSQSLASLAPATLYHYRVRSTDAAGNLALSSDATFVTLDNVPPVISSVSATNVTSSGSTITWTTDEPGDSQVEYGPTTSYGSSTTLNPSLVLAHSQPLTGLAAGTLYHYRVRSKDAAGNLALSSDATFMTLDNVPPVISSVSATGITSSSSTTAWTTNELADSQVEYGPTASYGALTTLNAGLVLPHSQALTGLAAGTLYHYRVRSRDAAGNLAVSGDFTFTTVSVAGPGPIAYLKLDEGAGTTAADASGNGNTGTLMNGAAWTAGTTGGGVALDGVNDYVRIPHSATLNAFPLSVTVWFKTTTTAGIRGLVNKYVAGSYNGYQVYFNNGSLCAWYMRDTGNYIYDGTDCPMSVAGYNDGQWHQAALVVDAVAGRLYLDGVQKGSRIWTGVGSSPTTTQELRLGEYSSSYLPAALDEFQLYSRALPATEVLQLYTDSRPPIDTTPPQLSGVGVASIGTTGAIITWTTDELADSRVEYGPTTAYGSATTLNPSLVLGHSEALTGLAAGTLYHYRVNSRDPAGNLAVSPDLTFTTLTGPDAGLIAYLKLNEGAGTTTADASGNGNTGTLMNGAAWTAGFSGQAVSLDGVNDHVRIAHAASLNAFPLSVAVWFKTTTTTGFRGLVNKYVAGSYNGYQIYFNNGTLCAWYMKDAANYIFDGTACPMSTTGYNDGQWHQAALVVDTTGGRLYVDGVQKGSRIWTGTAGAPTTAQEIHLGEYAGAYLPATLDEFRLYGRALSAAEAVQLYNTTRP